jgi:hypothetical protein
VLNHRWRAELPVQRVEQVVSLALPATVPVALHQSQETVVQAPAAPAVVVVLAHLAAMFTAFFLEPEASHPKVV